MDVDEWRDEPVRHRYVHGGFRGGNYYNPDRAFDLLVRSNIDGLYDRLLTESDGESRRH